MFWADLGSAPRIERANLDGSGRSIIVAKDIERPHGLALDFDLRRLYWSDATLDTIEFVDYSGR